MTIPLVAEAIGTVFPLSLPLLDEPAWSIGLSAAIDAAMGLAAWWVYRRIVATGV